MCSNGVAESTYVTKSLSKIAYDVIANHKYIALQCKIDEGGQGTAYAALKFRKTQNDEVPCCVKVLKVENDETEPRYWKSFLYCLNILKTIENDHILAIIEGRHHYIVTELLQGPTLLELLNYKQFQCPEARAKLAPFFVKTLHSVLTALATLHSLHIVHSDIHVSNIRIREPPRLAALPSAMKKANSARDSSVSRKVKFVDESEDVEAPISPSGSITSNDAKRSKNYVKEFDELPKCIGNYFVAVDGGFNLDGTVVVLDLDSCIHRDDTGHLEPRAIRHRCSMSYMSPELCLAELGPAADVWAAGILLFYMVELKYPFEHLLSGGAVPNLFKYHELIVQEKIKFKKSLWDCCEPMVQLKQLCHKLLKRDATKRFTAKRALAHPIFSLYKFSPYPSTNFNNLDNDYLAPFTEPIDADKRVPSSSCPPTKDRKPSFLKNLFNPAEKEKTEKEKDKIEKFNFLKKTRSSTPNTPNKEKKKWVHRFASPSPSSEKHSLSPTTDKQSPKVVRSVSPKTPQRTVSPAQASPKVQRSMSPSTFQRPMSPSNVQRPWSP